MISWTRALISDAGPSNDTAICVALVLGSHMDQDSGTSCFPSVTTIAAECRLSHVTVSRRLEDLCDLGWIARWEERTGRGRAWARCHYEATFPAGLDVAPFEPPWLTDSTWSQKQGAKRRYAPQEAVNVGDVRNLRSRGGKPQEPTCETSGAEVRNQVSTRVPEEVSREGTREVSATDRVGKKNGSGQAPRRHHLSDAELKRKADKLAELGHDLNSIVRQLSTQGATVERIHALYARQQAT